MNAKTEPKERKPQPQAARPYYQGKPALVAQYGSIGCAAIRAALQFRHPGAAKGR